MQVYIALHYYLIILTFFPIEGSILLICIGEDATFAEYDISIFFNNSERQKLNSLIYMNKERLLEYK